ncbi:MAG: Ig-like domain-containing protein [Boseongicola sp.]|nr:Ig-like domain-containing protein [Boseongicola sp.]
MRNILDPVNQWIGAPPLALSSNTNKRPVTLDDALSVLQDNGPVSVDVLANDFDPEGQPLTLVSASAALGTAVAEADNTVTYTPPPGITGFDTVVYTIEDDLGQTRDGQINVTITAPQLSIDTQPDNTLVVNAETGLIDITVTTPAAFAGTYQISTSDLAGGPVNLEPPAITGTVATGQTLTAGAGLWVYDPGAGVPQQGWQWRLAGADIAGATTDSYAVQPGDVGPGLAIRETQSDGFGQRFADSGTVGLGFTPDADGALIGWWDADDAATITETGGFASLWADRAGGANLAQSFGPEQPQTGNRTLNGRNVLDFDGSRRMLATMTLPASGDVAFHAALSIDGTASAFAALLSVDATNDFQIDADDNAAFDGRLNAAGIGTTTPLSGGPFSGALILSVIFDRTGAATAEVYIANQLRGSMAYTAPVDSAVALHLMSNRSLNANIDGAVAELVITGDVTNRADHHAYLANKWGLV